MVDGSVVEAAPRALFEEDVGGRSPPFEGVGGSLCGELDEGGGGGLIPPSVFGLSLGCWAYWDCGVGSGGGW